ncbi:hypothetical protein K504DRAFT_394283, partial [Pleomassaria siparia CBS 279.74]
GELWDTRAARISTVGKAEVEAYLRENPRTKIDWTPNNNNVSFRGQSPAKLLRTVRKENELGIVTFHVLDTPTPFLLLLADADRLGAYFNNVLNLIVRSNNSTFLVVRK